MPIRVTCQCGKSYNVGDQYAGRRFKCPACGAAVTAPAAAAAPAQAATATATAPAAEDAGGYDVQQPYQQQPQQPHYQEQPAYQAQPAYPPQQPAPGGQPLAYAAPGAAGGMPPLGGAPMLYPPPSVSEKFRRPGAPPLYLVFITEGADVNCGFDPSPALLSLATGVAKKVGKKHDVQIGPPPAPGAKAAFVRIITMDEGNRWLRYFFGIFFGATTFEVEGQVYGPSGQAKQFHYKHRGRIGFFGGDSLNLLKAGGKFLGTKIGASALKAT